MSLSKKALNKSALWDQLNAWESLGVEVESSGLHIEDWQRAQALVRLLPDEMARTISSKPELRTYAEKLNWVRHQIAHERATAMAAAVAKGPNDMQLGNLDAGAAAGADDWAGWTEGQEEWLCQFNKGKGKGPKGGKGGGKGPKGPKGGGKDGGGKGGRAAGAGGKAAGGKGE